MFSSCFVMQYLMSYLVLQSSHRGRDSWLLYFNCVAVSVVCLFPTVPLVGLQCVIVAFPGHTHTLFFLSVRCTFIRLRKAYLPILIELLSLCSNSGV